LNIIVIQPDQRQIRIFTDSDYTAIVKLDLTTALPRGIEPILRLQRHVHGCRGPVDIVAMGERQFVLDKADARQTVVVFLTGPGISCQDQ
jgi:hypothetical protein